jgi:hypothetical protein
MRDILKNHWLAVLIIILTLSLLFIFEFGSLNRAKALETGLDNVTSIGEPIYRPENEGRLIHTSGPLVSEKAAIDSHFLIEQDALLLKRIVEMYQWEEDRYHDDSGTRYTYRKIWSQELISSATFRRDLLHQNPTKMPLRTQIFKAPNISFGDFSLSQAFLHQIDYKRVRLDSDIFGELPKKIRDRYRFNNNYLYKGNPSNPIIGDLRVSFYTVKPGTFSIIGKQQEKVIRAFKTESGPVGLIMRGNLSHKEMFTVAQKENRSNQLLFRFFAALTILVISAYIYKSSIRK